MSFGNAPVTIDLTKLGTCFIIGENLDDGGSSGAGKTTIVNALSFVLFDKVPSKISKERLINRTNKDKKILMEVILSFSKGAEEYTVRRWRGMETGYKLERGQTADGLDAEQLKNWRADPDKPGFGWYNITNAAGFNGSIEELIGFSYELFKQIIIFDGNSTAFLDMGVSDQRALIEELLRITLLSRKAETLKDDIKETDSKIKIQQAIVQQLKLQADKQKAQVQEAEGRVVRWEEQHQAALDKAEADRRALTSVDLEQEAAVLTELDEILKELARLKGVKQEIETRLNAKNREFFPKGADLSLAVRELAALGDSTKKLMRDLEHLREAKCPFCLQAFADNKTKVLELEGSLQEAQISADASSQLIDQLKAEEKVFKEARLREVSALQAELEVAGTDVAQLDASVRELTGALTFKSHADIMKAKTAITAIEQRIAQLRSEVNPHVDALESLMKASDAKVDTTELDTLVKLKEHQQMLHKLLTDKNSYIRKAVISKTLPFINKRIAFYTERLGLPHLVKFMPDMSCEITKMGQDLDHGNLSNGQKKRLNLSLCFAFRDTLTYLHSKVNVLFTDEIDGGSLDEQSVNLMIGLLKHKAWDDSIGIYVISHRPEFDGRCDRNVVVRLEGGFSTLIHQPE